MKTEPPNELPTELPTALSSSSPHQAMPTTFSTSSHHHVPHEGDSSNEKEDLLNQVIKAFCGTSLKLERCKKLEEHHQSVRDVLRPLYDSGEPIRRITATILNHAFSCGQSVFILSVDGINELLKRDPCIDVESANDKTIQAFFQRAGKSGLEMIYPYIKIGPGQKARSGLYRIKLQSLREMFGEKVLSQETEVIQEYEDSNGIEEEERISLLDNQDSKSHKRSKFMSVGEKR